MDQMTDERFMRTTGIFLSALLLVAGCRSPDRRSAQDATFAGFDLNHDGNISNTEWAVIVDHQAKRLPNSSAADQFNEEGRRAFKNLDRNDDGKITPSEWRSGKHEVHMDEPEGSVR